MSVKHASSASQNIDELPPSPSDSTTLFADSRRLLKGTSTSLSYKADVFIFPTTQGVLIVASRASRPQINRNRNSKRTRLIIPELAMPETDAEALLLEMLLLRTLSQDDYLKKGNFIPVHRDRLRDEVGGQYLAAINSLVASSAIEVNHRYSAGRFPKSYRLSQSLRSCGVKDHHIHRAKASKGSQQVLANLTGVEKRLFRSLMRIRCPSDSDSLDEWDRVRFHFIRSGRYYVSRCEYGRFHSNFTAITKRYVSY